MPMRLISSRNLLVFVLAILLAGCGADAAPVVPTERPTQTPTLTLTPSMTPDADATATPTLTPAPRTATFGPTPTPLFGEPVVAQAATIEATALNPNAPRIEFFTTDVSAAAPGSPVNLFWSSRNAIGANIYRLIDGERNQVYPVPPDGQITVQTRRADRGALEFLLTVTDGRLTAEQRLSIPIACPDTWFFQPAPDACPTAPAQETSIIEQPFERGRMLYVQSSNTVYALLNDGRAPAWIALPNRFDPAVHAESEPEFNPPAGYYQPLRILGFVWRGNDTVRNRLGLATSPEFSFSGFVQSAPDGSNTIVYASSADGTVLQLLPDGDVWQIITPP